MCELTGFCSFPDATCTAGRRYDESAGDLKNECIGDRDNDGYPDATDNCPDLANDQGDEDGDGHGDACDPCPIDASSTDADMDGVADACDPDPALGGNKIVLFEGFHHGIPTGWQTTGAWTAANDGVDVHNGLQTNVFLTFPQPAGKLELRVGLTLIEIGGTTVAVGAAMRVRTSSNDALICSDTTGPNHLELGELVGGNYMMLASGTHGFAVGTHEQFALTDLGSNFKCATTTSSATGMPVNSGPPNPTLGVTSYGADAHVEWIMVVTRP
jgi:hypothetical protein